MAGFSFPPPPPPPPKATAQDGSSATNQTHPGSYGQRPARGGGDRGRGRGRGRGNQSRGGFGRGGAANYRGSMNQPFPQQQYASVKQNTLANGPSLNTAALPAGGYINPAFAPMYANAVNRAPSVPQPWLAQTPSSQTAGYSPSISTVANPPRPTSAQRPPHKPKVQTAPSVPSFGFALPTVQPQVLSADKNEQSKSKKRKHNQLGLTPRSDVHEDSEEDDADEETRFQAGGGAIQFEYKGRSSTLKSAEDIAAWIEERKKRFPTKERIAQKQKEEDEKKRARGQTEAEKRANFQPEDKQTKKRKRKDGGEQDKAIRKAEKLREKLRKAEEAVAKAKEKQESQRGRSEAAPKNSLGIDYDSDESADESNDGDSSSLAESSSEVSTDSDSDDSSSSDDDSGDDAPPEEESSAKRPLKVHLPNRKAPPIEPTRPRQDRHKQESRRMTLRERMLEQQRRQEAELALQAIKFLGQNGILG